VHKKETGVFFCPRQFRIQDMDGRSVEGKIHNRQGATTTFWPA
jgi:hypothetical protein